MSECSMSFKAFVMYLPSTKADRLSECTVSQGAGC